MEDVPRPLAARHYVQVVNPQERARWDDFRRLHPFLAAALVGAAWGITTGLVRLLLPGGDVLGLVIFPVAGIFVWAPVMVYWANRSTKR